MAENKYIEEWKKQQEAKQKEIEKYLPIYRRWFKIKYPKGVQIGIYDGGNDSGWVEIQLDLPRTALFEKIVLHYLLSEYGSFAGDFYCQGEIWYTEEGKFEAEGQESVTEWISYSESV